MTDRVIVSANEFGWSGAIAEKAHSYRQLVNERTHAVTQVVLCCQLERLGRVSVFQDMEECSISCKAQIWDVPFGREPSWSRDQLLVVWDLAIPNLFEWNRAQSLVLIKWVQCFRLLSLLDKLDGWWIATNAMHQIISFEREQFLKCWVPIFPLFGHIRNLPVQLEHSSALCRVYFLQNHTNFLIVGVVESIRTVKRMQATVPNCLIEVFQQEWQILLTERLVRLRQISRLSLLNVLSGEELVWMWRSFDFNRISTLFIDSHGQKSSNLAEDFADIAVFEGAYRVESEGEAGLVGTKCSVGGLKISGCLHWWIFILVAHDFMHESLMPPSLDLMGLDSAHISICLAD